ncbi:MAG: hypothetical protein ACRDJF_01675, partial [Actinomycetota bacterium]
AAVAALSLLFAGLDAREVAYQVRASRPSLVAIAALLAVMHLVASALAGVSWRRSTTSGPA